MLFTSEGGGDCGERRDKEEVVANYADERLIALMCGSGIGDFEESSWVAHAVRSNLRNTKDIIPSVVRHKGFELASRCLVSIGFFKGYMKHLTNNHGYPAPEFYIGVGKTTLIQEGRRDISEHFEDWTGFFHERFRVKTEVKEGVVAPVVYEKVREHKAYPASGTWKGMGPIERNYELGDLGNRTDEENSRN